MIPDSEQKGTGSEIPVGKYESKKQDELRSEEPPQETDESVARDIEGQKVRVDKTRLGQTDSVRVKVDVEAEKQKAETARLNERLRRLRSRR